MKRLRRRKEPQIASRRSLLAAAAIDFAATFTGLGSVGAAVIGLRAAGVKLPWGRLPDWMRPFQPPTDEGEIQPTSPRLDPRLGFMLRAISVVAAVFGRNYRSPGQRKMRLRKVELRTGGPVSIRAAIVQWGASEVWRELLKLAFSPLSRRSSRRLREAQPEIEEIRRRHRGDAQALNRETMQLFKERRINPLTSCGWGLLHVAVGGCATFLTPRHQSIPELIAGVARVRE